MIASTETMISATVAESIAAAANRLRAAGIEDARREARLLIGAALGMDAPALFARPERPLSASETQAIDELIRRRAAREPAARLLGHREFWSRSFALTADTLVPRPDSETVIEAALAALPERNAPLEILDLGTGTGCLLVALLTEYPRAVGLAVDRAYGAAAAAARNIRAAGLRERAQILVADWSAPIRGRFDLIVSNPPYIPRREIPGLAPEVAEHEPLLALDGGEDGLDCYRALAKQLPGLLRQPGPNRQGGIAILELGAGQGAAVSDLMRQNGLEPLGFRCDLAGIERSLILRGADSAL